MEEDEVGAITGVLRVPLEVAEFCNDKILCGPRRALRLEFLL